MAALSESLARTSKPLIAGLLCAGFVAGCVAGFQIGGDAVAREAQSIGLDAVQTIRFCERRLRSCEADRRFLRETR